MICTRVKPFQRLSLRRFSIDVANQTKHLRSEYDAVIIGGGHNGLVAAAYLAKAGQSVCVLERREIIGGAAVTEEIVPGFKFSRASYSLTALRPIIYKDLELKRHGLNLHIRNYVSYTPLLKPTSSGATSLLLGSDVSRNESEISKFSIRDSKIWPQYLKLIQTFTTALDPLLDLPPIDLVALTNGGLMAKKEQLASLRALLRTGRMIGPRMSEFYDLMTTPSEKFLGKWFESELLKAALAKTAIIGAQHSPRSPGSGYHLLHWSMGSLEGEPGFIAYPEGGMGAVSNSIASAARENGAFIFTNKEVDGIIIDKGRTAGVHLTDGTKIRAKLVLSNATARITFSDLLSDHQDQLPESLRRHLAQISYKGSCFRINVAVSRLPIFVADPKPGIQPLHQATAHLNSETCQEIHSAFLDAENGRLSQFPIIRMSVPSAMDPTLAPPGAHVVLLFVEYTPYKLAGGAEWTDADRKASTDLIINTVETYCPGFKSSIVGVDSLSPRDLQDIFNLTEGNIYQGEMSLDQIYFNRPTANMNQYRSPIQGLYLCGASVHPGGGVMGSAGRLAALSALEDLKNSKFTKL